MDKKEKDAYLTLRARQVTEGIRRERMRRGWSLHRMALELGLDKSYLYRIESGAVSPGLKNLIVLCDRLGLDISIAPAKEMINVDEPKIELT